MASSSNQDEGKTGTKHIFYSVLGTRSTAPSPKIVYFQFVSRRKPNLTLSSIKVLLESRARQNSLWRHHKKKPNFGAKEYLFAIRNDLLTLPEYFKPFFKVFDCRFENKNMV